jgi:hypothetical protein
MELIFVFALVHLRATLFKDLNDFFCLYFSSHSFESDEA